MPHRVDIDSIHQTTFILLNVAYAAKEIAQNHDIHSDETEDTVNSVYYEGWLRYILSEKLIEIAIKIRVLLDVVRDEDNKEYESVILKTDQQVCKDYNIGFFVDSSNYVSIREVCNKIIHAKEIFPLLEKGEDEHFQDEESEEKREWEYWDGTLELIGQKGKKDWCFHLHLRDFCLAIEDFITGLEDSVDWYHIYKYDNVF